VSGRLRPFEFILVRGDEILEVTFYALSGCAAVRIARDWAAPRGWTVEEPAA